MLIRNISKKSRTMDVLHNVRWFEVRKKLDDGWNRAGICDEGWMDENMQLNAVRLIDKTTGEVIWTGTLYNNPPG